MGKNKKDGLNPNAGPGNYKLGNESSALSTCINREALKFAQAPREDMAMSNRSPGPCYLYEGIYRTGRDTRIHTGFNKDNRKPLNDFMDGADALYQVRMPKSTSIGFSGAKRFKYKQNIMAPGPIYNTQKYDFKT